MHARTTCPCSPGWVRTTRPPSTSCSSPVARRTWSSGRTWRRSSRRPTGGCSASAWTRCARSTARSPTAGTRPTARSSTGCARSSPSADRCARHRSSMTPRRRRAGPGGTGTSSRTPWSTCGCSARSRSPAAAASSAATASPSTFCRRTSSPPPSPRDDAIRELIARAAKAHGVGTASDLADYWRIKDRRAVMTAIGDLQDAGVLQPVTVRGLAVCRSPGEGVGAPGCRAPPSRGRRSDPHPVRSGRLVPRSRGAPVRLRVPHRDLHPGAAAALRVLLAPGADRRRHRGARSTSRPTVAPPRCWCSRRGGSTGVRRMPRPDSPTKLRAAARWQGLESISVSRWGDATDDLADALRDARRHEAGPAAPIALAPEEPEPLAVNE